MNVELIDVSCVVAWLKNKKKGKGHKKPLFSSNIVIEKNPIVSITLSQAKKKYDLIEK